MRVLSIVAITIIVLTIAGCGQKSAPPINVVGTWSSQSPHMTYVFNADGTGTATQGGQSTSFTYTKVAPQDNSAYVQVSLQSGGHPYVFQYTPPGTLTLANGSQDQAPVVFTRS